MKKIVSVVLAVVLCLSLSMTSYARAGGGHHVSDRGINGADYPEYFKDWTDSQKARWFQSNIHYIVAVVGNILLSGASDIVSIIRSGWEENYYVTNNLVTYEDWLAQNYSVDDDGNISLTDDMTNLIQLSVEQYKKDCGYTICYCTPMASLLKHISNKSHYDDLREFVQNANSEGKVVCIELRGGGNQFYIYTFDADGFVVDTLHDDWNNMQVDIYKNWKKLNDADNCFDSTLYTLYVAPFSSWGINELSGGRYGNSPSPFLQYSKNVAWNGNGGVVLSDISRGYKVWNNLEAYKNNTVGNTPYYAIDGSTLSRNWYEITEFNTKNEYIYNNYDNSDDDVTNYYGDIIYNPPAVDDGGGSGGDSGGSSGDSNGGIFDWIGSLGEVLGNLVKNIGALITDVLAALSSVFTDVLTIMPDSVIGFFSAAVPFIPADVWALVRLAMALGLVGMLIKFFRG